MNTLIRSTHVLHMLSSPFCIMDSLFHLFEIEFYYCKDICTSDRPIVLATSKNIKIKVVDFNYIYFTLWINIFGNESLLGNVSLISDRKRITQFERSLRTGYHGRYMDPVEGKEPINYRENCITRNSILCILHQILLG